MSTKKNSKSKINPKEKKLVENSMMLDENSERNLIIPNIDHCLALTNISSSVASDSKTKEVMEIIALEKKLKKDQEDLSTRVRKLVDKTEGVSKGKVKKSYGITKDDALYKCVLDEFGKMIRGSYRACMGKSLHDIAEEVIGTKNGRDWSSWKEHKTGNFVRGTFKWLTKAITA